MGFFDGASVVSTSSRRSRTKRHSSHSHSHSRHQRRRRSRSRSNSRSRSRSRSRQRKTASVVGFLAGAPSNIGDHYSSSRRNSSFFGLGNASRGSFFGLGRTPSYYKRSPRQKFMHRAWKKLKRIIRDLVHYAKRHPWKVFMLVIMPLITTGALAGLLARFGLRLPREFEQMLGMAAKAGSGDSIGMVSDAVRMASDMGATGTTSARYSYSSTSRSGGGDDWSGGSWGVSDGLKYVGKLFS